MWKQYNDRVIVKKKEIKNQKWRKIIIDWVWIVQCQL